MVNSITSVMVCSRLRDLFLHIPAPVRLCGLSCFCSDLKICLLNYALLPSAGGFGPTKSGRGTKLHLDDNLMSVKSASPKRQDVSNSADKNKKAKNKPKKGST